MDELKKSYQAGGPPSGTDSDSVRDYEMNEEYLYANPMGTTAFQPDSTRSGYSQVITNLKEIGEFPGPHI